MRATYSHHTEDLRGMLQLEYELKKMCREHRVDGRTTQSDRLELAATVARDLDASGYHRFSRQKNCSRKLKDKHVRGLVAHWTGKGLSPGTINNRLAFLRHVCEWTGRGGVMSKRNADYHEGKRIREATVSKAAYIGTEVLNRVRNRYAQASLRLQIAFGLRRKEALMIQLAWADRGNRIVLQDTWTKGGRQREIPLTTPAQRQALDHAKAVAGNGSMIPPSLSYKGYRDGLWQTACKSIGLTGTHGFRHAYAQDRYEVLAGFPCPVRGGPKRDEMTAEQLQLDEWARGRVSSELGHGRHRVTNWYLGKG